MKRTLSWKQALQKKYIKTAAPDKHRTLQMQKMALLREEFLEEEIDEKFIALQLEAYYDIIKELLYAHMYRQGFVCNSPSYLPLYAKHHFHGFSSEVKSIETLFAMKAKLHSLSAPRIQKYLQENEQELKGIIERTKQKLREL